MILTESNVSPLEYQGPCLVIPIWHGGPFSEEASSVNQALGGLLEEVQSQDGFKATVGNTLTLHHVKPLNAGRIVLLGMGTRKEFTINSWRKAVAQGARAVRALKKTEFALINTQKGHCAAETLAQATAEAVILGLHQYNDLKSPDADLTEITNFTLLTAQGRVDAQPGLDRGLIVAEANLVARNLVDLPSNLKSPETLAETARILAREKGLRVEVWDEVKLQEERMLALWGVGRGSERPPRFIILEYVPPGQEDTAPLALIGKGMTYDTGGYSLKPSPSMEDMKDDLGGAAAVLGAMSALKALGVKRRVLGVIPTAENMVSGGAQRPGDVVKARNGKTIEVLNTDAEGRLILADALSWTCEQKPTTIIDLATLTGAIGIALGREAAGLFSNDDATAQALTKSGAFVGEPLWRMPLYKEFRDALKGTVSDLKNIAPEKRAGSIIAATFLQHFVDEPIHWAHLDIAAVALVKEELYLTKRGATGFGVRLLLHYLSALEPV